MRNSILESSPNPKTLTNETSEKVMNLRPREEQKELSRTFRFKATSQAERIAECVAKNLGKNQPKSFMIDKQAVPIETKKSKRLDSLTIDPRHTSMMQGSVMSS